ncbi:MAG: helix-turn-helix domain-containing protein [Bacteroidaceae bacterium]|nr:helix-turn-helix domain-containing protein [Bacteroidaceae bacterium]
MASQYSIMHSFRSTIVTTKAGRKKIFMRWWMAWAVAFLSCMNCRTQEYSYHPLPTQEQLPVANVNVIVQDHDGYMWYGTAGGGLCRDDGYEVVTYSSKTAGQGIMESDEITCIAEDQTGRIWFGTRAGLYYINNVERTVHRMANEHVGQKKVNCIGVTSDGCVWVGVQRDVVKFSPEGTFVKALSIGDNPREETKEMMVDSRGKLWLTILRGGIASIDPKTDRLQREPWDYTSAAGYMLEDTVRRCYWVGTWGGGIVQYPQMMPQPATMVSTENQHFGSEVYNLWIDQRNSLVWVSTMDDVYAYQIVQPQNRITSTTLQPYSTHTFMPMGKKLIGKLIADRRGNIWVPGSSPHTFILSPHSSGSDIRRNEVKAMTEQMGYKVMVHQIAREGDYYWIYQNRTRLSLYDPATNRLTFMATDASTTPSPLSTQRPLSRCKADKGVWTCNGKRLIHAWHEGMKICWEEIGEAQTPNYISALSDQGNGHLLIGTEKQVFLFDYRKKTLKPLTDSVGIVQQVASPHAERLAQSNWQITKGHEAAFTTDPKAPQVITDKHGHVWTLNELTLQEYSPRTGATRILKASDRNIEMDNFTDITLVGDSVCVGGIGAYCMIGYCKELDLPHPDDRIVVTHYDTLRSISVSTMNHLHAADIQFAYRINTGEWVTMPAGEHSIDISNASFGTNILYVKATDEYGVWHHEQEVFRFSLPLPWHLRWYSWCIYVALILFIYWLFTVWRERKQKERKNGLKSEDEIVGTEKETEQGTGSGKEADQAQDNEERERKNFVTEVNEWIEKNLDNTDYGVDELCRDLGMSRMNLYRKFQRLSLPTPSEFIKSYRLKKAALLLRTTNQSITEIAYAVGFTSPQYFAKCFKDEYGSQPTRWRHTLTTA